MIDGLPLRHVNVFQARNDGYFPKRSLNVYKKSARAAAREPDAQSQATRDYITNLNQQLRAAQSDLALCPRYYPGTLGSTYAAAACTLAAACLLGSGIAICLATPAPLTACLLAATSFLLVASVGLTRQDRRLPNSFHVTSGRGLPGDTTPLCSAGPAPGGAFAVERLEKRIQTFRNGEFVAVKKQEFKRYLFASFSLSTTLANFGVTSHDLAHEKLALFTTLQAPHAADPRYLEYGRSFASTLSSDLASQLCVSLDSLVTIKDASQTRAALHHGWNVDWFNTFRSGLNGRDGEGAYHLHGIAVLSVGDSIFLSAQGGACSAHLVSSTGHEVVYLAPCHELADNADTENSSSDHNRSAVEPLQILPTTERKKAKQTVLRIPRSKFASANLVLSTHEAFDAALAQHGSQLNNWLQSLRCTRSTREQSVDRLPTENENDYRGLLVLHPEFFAPGA